MASVLMFLTIPFIVIAMIGFAIYLFVRDENTEKEPQ